jgi:hypothetical protein
MRKGKEVDFFMHSHTILTHSPTHDDNYRNLFHRFGPWFAEPIVAGLRKDGSVFLSGMDLIGAPVFAEDFVVSGTCTSNLHGMCEALYKKDMVSILILFSAFCLL